MSLSNEIQQEQVACKRNQIELVIDQLSGDDLTDFINALNDDLIPAAILSRVLARRNIRLDKRRISDYRNNGGLVRYGLDGKRVS
jgi:hypothetical protein